MMDELYFIVALIFIFSAIYFLDLIFRTCWFFPYLRLLHVTGITVKPFALIWETTKLNRRFYSWSHFKPTFLRVWFQTGTYVSLMCMIPALCVVSYSFWVSLEKPSPSQPDSDDDIPYTLVEMSNDSSSNTPLIIPIIPGLTLPFSQIFFYIITVFLCMLFHEMGHAVASSRENVAIEGCGIGLYGIFPWAYVKLPSERLSHLLPWQQLRIFCAGIWHNIVLSGFALLLLWCSPIFLSLFFQSENGVSVISVKEGSGVAQPSGLVAYDHIFSVNDCEVRNINSWKECLKLMHTNTHQGFCSSNNFVKIEDISKENATNCCPDSSEYLCFQQMDIKEHFCLPGRKLAEKAKVCNFNTECGNGMCLVPILVSYDERFLKIERHLKAPVLYIGSIQELKSTVTISGWTTRFRAISVLYADIYETILVYIVTVSSGLAIMNLIPCYGLDGAYLTEIIVHHYISNIIAQYKHRCIAIKLTNFLGLFITVYAGIYGTIKYIT